MSPMRYLNWQLIDILIKALRIWSHPMVKQQKYMGHLHQLVGIDESKLLGVASNCVIFYFISSFESIYNGQLSNHFPILIKFVKNQQCGTLRFLKLQKKLLQEPLLIRTSHLPKLHQCSYIKQLSSGIIPQFCISILCRLNPT